MTENSTDKKPRGKAVWTETEKIQLKNIGILIEKLRKEKSISPVQICTELEMNKSNYRRIEREGSNITFLLFLRICTALEIEPSDFLRLLDEM